MKFSEHDDPFCLSKMYTEFSFLAVYAKMNFYTFSPSQTILKALFQVSLLIAFLIYKLLCQMMQFRQMS